MAATIAMKVLTAEGVALEDQAVSVIAPGEVGHVGFLRNHAPLVTTLGAGRLKWRTPAGEEKAVRIGAGLLEVVKNRLTILTDSVEQ